MLGLTQQGRRCSEQGDLDGAIDRYRRACDLVRQEMQSEPGDAEEAQQLGSMSYTLGEWLLQAEDYQAAIDALDEAETAYQSLGAQAAQRVVDVVIRRARVCAAGAARGRTTSDLQRR